MKIVKNDLESSLINSMVSSLEVDVQDTASLIGVIDNFISEINSGNNLYGESYKSVAKKLEEYKKILEKRKTVATSLKSAIKYSTKQMIAFMDYHEIIDQSKKQEYENSLQQAYNSLTELYRKIYSAESFELQKELRNQLSYPLGLVEKFNAFLNKINGLSDADNSAYGLFNFANTSLTGYKGLVNALEQSNITSL